MKRLFSAILCLSMLLVLALPLTASADGQGWYIVESQEPKGYAYLYSRASDRYEVSENLGRYNNGSYVYVINYYGGRDGRYNYCYVQTQDGKTGYMHDYALVRYYGDVWAENGEGWYIIASVEPDGYTYLYSNASDRDEVSENLGRYNNNQLVYVLDYYGGRDGAFNYCYVRTATGQTGYMHDYVLWRYGDSTTDPKAGWYTVASESPKGYCYLYTAASDRYGISENRGRYNNGEQVYVLSYYGGQDGKYNYCYVLTQSGKAGYMHDYALQRN